MANITAEIPGESKDVIIISSHYDTKYFKDMRFVGANDPGASVGTLLELGRVLGASQQKPKLTYWLVFFDGEESFCEGWDDCHNPNPNDPKTLCRTTLTVVAIMFPSCKRTRNLAAYGR